MMCGARNVWGKLTVWERCVGQTCGPAFVTLKTRNVWGKLTVWESMCGADVWASISHFNAKCVGEAHCVGEHVWGRRVGQHYTL